MSTALQCDLFDQGDLFDQHDQQRPPSWAVEALRYHRARLQRDGRIWPAERPYLLAVVRRFERAASGVPECDLGPWPERDGDTDVAPSPQAPARAPRQQSSGRCSGSAGVVTPAEVSRVGLFAFCSWCGSASCACATLADVIGDVDFCGGSTPGAIDFCRGENRLADGAGTADPLSAAGGRYGVCARDVTEAAFVFAPAGSLG